MHPEIAKAHCETLIEWARLHEADGAPGATEAAFLMRRAARTIAKGADIQIALPPEPRPSEPSVTDVKDG